MLKIENLKVKLSDGDKEILHGVNLGINPGEIVIINGKNGSGKSTLVNAIMGNPQFEITEGQVRVTGEKYDEFTISSIDGEFVNSMSGTVSGIDDYIEITISEIEPNERSLAGVYLANQYPTEIPGVGLSHFLRLIYNSRRPKDQQLNVYKFKQFLKEKAELIKYPEHLLTRNLNEGFSGGEKKKTEILQMLILEPRYVMLDEVDSGLDRQSVKDVFQGLADYNKLFPNTAFIIISHYDKVQEYLTPDRTIEMSDGLIIS
jgi:Fe-S cluster assembly ATP-binding protein